MLDVEFRIEHYEERAEAGDTGAHERVEQAKEELKEATNHLNEATGEFERFILFTRGAAWAIAILLIIDLALIPGMVHRAAAREQYRRDLDGVGHDYYQEIQEHMDPALKVRTPMTDVIDTVNKWVGEFVAYWSLIAVFVYYYEVVARYIFNSPTNWAHEGMFLMFGMQYLLAGGYALKEDAHVRVDVIYNLLPVKGRVIADLITSLFFFVFMVTLLVTGWIFFMDSVSVWEVSFTEWAIQYWPVKATISLGALLLILQGISKLVKDVVLLSAREA
jgi:TRAP-type mannitol/chloroaromatic compound transport system permease small subunit